MFNQDMNTVDVVSLLNQFEERIEGEEIYIFIWFSFDFHLIVLRGVSLADEKLNKVDLPCRNINLSSLKTVAV